MTEALLEPGGIAPPREHLELGDWVVYHHRACVLRLTKQEYTGSLLKPASQPVPREWTSTGVGRFIRADWFSGENPLDLLPKNGKINKTIYVWPEEGKGCLVGLVRRGIGHSVGPSGGSSFYTDDYEPGYFDTKEWHWLYVIKLWLAGIEKTMVLAPMWATRKTNRRRR